MKVERAYSRIEVKSFDDDLREIRGIASTPSTDRMGDVVTPSGAKFDLPIPLLWQHWHDSPIGNVVKATVTDAGIEIVARLVKPIAGMPTQLVARLEEAWASIKTGLVRGLSIGFSSNEYSYIDTGINFLSWDWHELSVVTIPANSDASIQQIRSISQKQMAATGHKSADVKFKKSGVSAIKKPKNCGDHKMKTLAEQIADFEATRKTKIEERSLIMQKSNEEGRTLDAEESETYDTLADEIKQLDKHISRMKEMQKSMGQSATPVSEDPRASSHEEASRNLAPVRAKNTQKLEPGIAFARAAKCLALGHLEHRSATDIAKSLYGDREDIVATTHRLQTKTAVAPATTADATWAKPLVDTGAPLADFIEFLRPQTILGRFGQNGVPSLRNIGFRLPIVGQTTGGQGYWVGEGQAKPLTKFDFTGTSLDPLKVANIAVASMEVIRDSRPAADLIIRDQLAAALAARLDIDFIDPAKAAVQNVSPASILNGANGVPSVGGDAESVRADLRALFSAFIAANNAPTSGVFIMPATTALALSLMVNPLGQAEFPGLTMNGGTLSGLPVIVSQYVPADSDGAVVALVNASDIYIGDEGGIDLSMATEASLEMDDSPANPTVAATVMVSLWQRNLVGFRAERTINWARRRPSAAAYLTGVQWGVTSA